MKILPSTESSQLSVVLRFLLHSVTQHDAVDVRHYVHTSCAKCACSASQYWLDGTAECTDIWNSDVEVDTLINCIHHVSLMTGVDYEAEEEQKKL